MYKIILFTYFLYTVNGASYQRFDESTRFPTYSTISNLYNQNQFPYKTNYGSDIETLPEATRYPNYKPGYTTVSSNIYSTAQTGNVFLQDYTTPRYGGQNYGYSGQGYGQGGQNYGQGYNGQTYGQAYGGQTYGQGYNSYELPFMKYNKDYCVNRLPQKQIFIDSLTGMWYGVEFIQHLAGDARVDYAKTCIVVHISEPFDKVSDLLSITLLFTRLNLSVLGFLL